MITNCRQRRRPRRGGAQVELGAQFSTETIAKAMELARVEPALVYAFRKTGFMPTEDALDLYSTEELAEYEAAITEFEAGRLVGTAGGAA